MREIGQVGAETGARDLTLGVDIGKDGDECLRHKWTSVPYWPFLRNEWGGKQKPHYH